MDDTTRSIIRNVKGPGTTPHSIRYHPHLGPAGKNLFGGKRRKESCANFDTNPVRENDILCLLESEREARRLR